MSKPTAQTLFEEIRKQKTQEALETLSAMAEPCIRQMKAAGLVVEDTDSNGRKIIRGTTKLATEASIGASCESLGIDYLPDWMD